MQLNRKQPGDRGFTLIELLIVVVIVGILAAIAIPKFSSSKERANTATIKADLRSLITAEEAYFSNNSNTYAPNIDALGTTYRTSAGVTVTIGSVAATGWSASATHSGSSKTCTISLGGTASNEGVPVCD